MLPEPTIFDPGRTHCPSCNATQANLANQCSFCGFTAQISVQRFPFEPPPLTRFVDPNGSLSNSEQRSLNKAISKFEKRFPQITVSVCVMTLPEGVDGREFGYWYFNSSAPTGPTEREQRIHKILLVVNEHDNTVSVTVGYGLDCFLDDITLDKISTKAEPKFRHGGLIRGIANWLKIVSHELTEIWDDASYAYDRWLRHHGENPLQDATMNTVTESYREVVDIPNAAPVPPRPRTSAGQASS